MIFSYVYLDCSIYSLIFNKKRSLDCAVESTREAARKKCREKHSTTSRVSPHFLSALAASCALYNRTEQSQGFSICFIIKNPLNSPSITFNFQNKLYFQSEQQCRQHALYSHKARYNKPIRILVRMVQII